MHVRRTTCHRVYHIRLLFSIILARHSRQANFLVNSAGMLLVPFVVLTIDAASWNNIFQRLAGPCSNHLTVRSDCLGFSHSGYQVDDRRNQATTPECAVCSPFSGSMSELAMLQMERGLASMHILVQSVLLRRKVVSLRSVDRDSATAGLDSNGVKLSPCLWSRPEIGDDVLISEVLLQSEQRISHRTLASRLNVDTSGIRS